jgi:acyl-CoA reductase-like NAD-dependent aldehyde dehydrogenase
MAATETTGVLERTLLIGDGWRAAASGATLDVVNPATEEVAARVASAGPDDVDAAVRAAQAALDGPWARLSARERGRLLWRIGERLMERADEVARLETLHNGKPIFESRQIDIPSAAECFQYYAGWADKVHGDTIPVKGNYLTYTLREPVGVVAAIVPWNFPLLLAAWKIAPALACGNTVVLKPASQTPLTALALGEIAIGVGVPPGVLNVITGLGSSVGRAIIAHPGVAKVAFTGDTSTGREIMRSSADTLSGLAAAVWTRDIKKAHHVARRLQAGTVWVNAYNVYDAAAPFGGYKDSGFGRELGEAALEHSTQVKTVWVDLNR